ncbi:MAG TPA: DUF4136 domain-containing protein [Candidatus Krumholzibacteria bacterium]|nr:DUF4136 domain-containing protein [Candidatus Krumholzibacteria bacterium]
MATLFFRMRGRARSVALVAAGLAVVAVLGSCYPGDELTISESDVVITTFDGATDFETIGSYALADSIIHLVPDGEKDNISRAYDAMMLATIRSNMAALGFSEEADPANADVLIVTAVSSSEYTTYYSYSPCYYYCWYYPYPPGWGWYYPSTVGSYNYTVGTIFVNMTRRVDPNTADRLPVVWVAALNGLADKNSNASRIKAGINQAFAQSKYLGAGK